MPRYGGCCCGCKCKMTDILLLIDTTGSMGSIIAAVQDAITRIVSQLSRSTLPDEQKCRWAVAEYKDDIDCGNYRVNDADGIHIIQTFTLDLDDIQAAVDGLTASGGGNAPEEQMKSLMTACTYWVSMLDGDPDTEVVGGDTRFVRRRVIVYIGDAVGHEGSIGSLAEFKCVTSSYPLIYPTLAAVIACVTDSDNCIQVFCLDYGADATGQATALADATSGIVFPGSLNPNKLARQLCAALKKPRLVCE